MVPVAFQLMLDIKGRTTYMNSSSKIVIFSSSYPISSSTSSSSTHIDPNPNPNPIPNRNNHTDHNHKLGWKWIMLRNGIRLLKYYQKRQENPDDVYKMESSPRGKVLIINNKSFDDPRTLYREGTDEDCARLLDLFVNRLHFDACPVAENCTAEEMLVQLSNFARDPQLSQVDACAVIILSHGGEGDTIHGTDGRSIRRIDVAGIFNTIGCPAMKDKPKLFIFQACRGRLQDTSSGHRQVACDPVLEQTPLSGPTYADQYFLCPTVEGFVAYRGPFVQLLCEVFQELADTEHVKDMATQARELQHLQCRLCNHPRHTKVREVGESRLCGNSITVAHLLRVKDTELDFAKAVKIAIETEDAAKVAKETVYGSKPRPVNKVKMNNKGGRPKNHQQSNSTTSNSAKCYRLDVPVTIQDQQFTMELDTATTGNFVSVPVWKQLGKPKLDDVTHRYESASKHDLPVLGTFMGQTKDPVTGKQSSIPYIVTKIPDLNLLGRNAIQALGISVDNALGLKSIESQVKSEGAKESHPKTSSTTYASLQKDCHTLCDKFPDLFKEELGCLKDFELEVKFKSDAKPVFHKARPVPFALRDDLTKGYEEGIAKGVWKPVQFNDYGTPVVPIRKTNSAGALKPKLRICGDYSVGINDQLADHRHPMPLPEELMQKLGGGFGYTKIDLADAYNQIKLAPESQRRLALSTHRAVLLQQRLPFGIKSAPGYFQEIMENLTSDLPGVAVFQDDILTSGKDAKDHLSNLERLLTRLNDKGLRCRREKCPFAQPSVEYLGHTLSAEGISKGSKVEAVLKMPPPTDVSSLKSFLGSVQFYGKFIPNLATMAEPLYRLTKKASPWKWGEEEQAAFEQLKNVLSSDQVLVHFDPDKPVGLACDASNVGIGAVLFHRYPDGSERPIANVSKTLTAAERNYSQIHKEALAIIYGLRKFYQYLYGRQFILVTDHKPLTTLFGPKKGTPLLAANRLARWALWLNQFDYTIEYRKTADHGNADALSRLPSVDDIDFDREESGEDTDMVCAIRVLSLQVKPFDANILRQESGKDPVIATVMRYVREGWPLKHAEINEEVRKFQKLSDSLSICHGCLIYGTRVVIPQSLQPKILDLLHIGHFGMERMKQLARTAVYWPGIDAAIEMTSRRCDSCGEHQNKPSKPPVHPWMLPEKPWSRVHLDHAINFMGTNWLVITDAYSKYPCIHPTSSTSTRATLDLLEEDFAHFGYPHTLVSDNATTFVSEEFQSWCKERGITHLTGAPYHPATNGAAERLVQTFKQALRKSSLPPKRALQEFLMQYRRMPTSCGFSPSELLMSRQIRTRIDTLLPSPAHIAQGKQSKEASKTQVTPDPGGVAKVTRQYKAGDPVYALYYGPHHAKQPRWVPAVVKKSTGTRCFNVKVVPRGPVWRRHWEQLRPRYASEEDNEPGDSADASELPIDHPMEILENVPPTQNQSRPRLPRTKPPVPDRIHKKEISMAADTGFNDRMCCVLRELRPDLIKQLVVSHDLLAHLMSRNVFQTDEYILVYNADSMPRGHMLVIDNEYFDSPYIGNRDATQ
nr:hypothetical protein BaRGS_024854 [Batillaria attramentaria]